MKRVDWYKPFSFVACLVSALLFWVSTEAQSIIPESAYDLAVAGKFVFDPKTQHWKAINSEGEVVRSGRGSGGRAYCADTGRRCKTPSGSYQIIQKRGADCRSSRYPVGKGGSPMPYCMFFSQYYAIHGSYHVPNYNASHGCIRILPADAKWLYYNFIEVGTPVIVKPY